MFHSEAWHYHINKRYDEHHDKWDIIQDDGRTLVFVLIYVQATDNQENHSHTYLYNNITSF